MSSHLLCLAQSIRRFRLNGHSTISLVDMQVGYFRSRADYAISQSDSDFRNTVNGSPYPSDG